MDKLYDFDSCEMSYNCYGGSDKKAAIILDGRDYMVKFPSLVGKKNDLNTSVSNNIISEYIACKIVKSMDIPVQEVKLGYYQDSLVVACEDFLKPNEKLFEFSKIENKVIDSSERGRTPVLSNLEQTFQSFAIPDYLKQEAIERYWDTFVIDSFIGNFDRHSGNWGYIVDQETKKYSVAPVYDCGSSIFPQLADKSIEKILSNPDEIQMRIDTFPKATLSYEPGGPKIGYKEFFLSGYDECEKALLRTAPKISMEKVFDIIDNTPVISDVRKDFYKTMLEQRYQQIILEPYLEISQKRGIEISDTVKEYIDESLIEEESDIDNFDDFLKGARDKADEINQQAQNNDIYRDVDKDYER